MDAPTARELLQVPAVQRAIEGAWADSMPTDPDNRHEEGGWVFLNPKTGEYLALRAVPGARKAINLNRPYELYGYYVVGKFHTHPNPSADGWETGPSLWDQRTDAIHGVPSLIRADDGVHLSGPARRRGGLTGPRGYPELGDEE